MPDSAAAPSCPSAMPTHAARLFFGYHPEDLLRPHYRSFLVGRILEEGDSRDLAWLLGFVPAAELSSWLNRPSSQQLSHRSRQLWSLVFDASPPPPENVSPLWPL